MQEVRKLVSIILANLGLKDKNQLQTLTPQNSKVEPYCEGNSREERSGLCGMEERGAEAAPFCEES